MDHFGIDVHNGASQICVIAEGGELIEQRVRTEPARLAEALEDRVRARILIEASTESEYWKNGASSSTHAKGSSTMSVRRPSMRCRYGSRRRSSWTSSRSRARRACAGCAG